MSKIPQKIILEPIITEQSIAGLEEGKYTFKVAKDSNKIEIKKAVEQLFEGVEVFKVNTLNVRAKSKRMGRYKEGKTASYKKAVVTLRTGSKTIEFFDGLH
jgi:large subunit ribosomal protein L23